MIRAARQGIQLSYSSPKTFDQMKLAKHALGILLDFDCEPTLLKNVCIILKQWKVVSKNFTVKCRVFEFDFFCWKNSIKFGIKNTDNGEKN